MTDSELPWWLTPGSQIHTAESSPAESSAAESSAAESSAAESSAAESSASEALGTKLQAIANDFGVFLYADEQTRQSLRSKVERPRDLAHVPRPLLSSRVAIRRAKSASLAPPDSRSVLADPSPYALPLRHDQPLPPPKAPWRDNGNKPEDRFPAEALAPQAPPFQLGFVIETAKFPYMVPGDHAIYEITTVIRHVSPNDGNNPRCDATDTAIIYWDRAGRDYFDFGDATTNISLSDNAHYDATKMLFLHDLANPDEYWPDGKMLKWRSDLCDLFGRYAIAAFVTRGHDRLLLSPTFPLSTKLDAEEFLHVVDRHGETADGLVIVSPRTTRNDPASNKLGYHRIMEREVSEWSAWCYDQLLEVQISIPGDPEPSYFETCYGNDVADIAAARTSAKLEAMRRAKAHQVRCALSVLEQESSGGLE